VPWGCNEWAWRAAVANDVRRCCGAQMRVVPTTTFSTSLDFRLLLPQAARCDLDSIAKPVLDTLFTLRRPQVKDVAITGVLFNVDDDIVFALQVSKREASTVTDAGITVHLSWS
jgi:hypothetical protein